MAYSVILSVLACLVTGLGVFVIDLVNKRKRLDGLPAPPMKSHLLGHLDLLNECTKLLPKSSHPQDYFGYVQTRYDLPEAFYMDWRPFGPLWLVLADPEVITEYIVSKQNLPKSIFFSGYFDKLIGPANIVTLEGERWKSLRSLFNPGFAAANLMAMAGSIVDAGIKFRAVLREKSETNELFELEELATRLTVDIIGIVIFDVNMNSQSQPHPIAQYFRERLLLIRLPHAIHFWQDVQPLRPLRIWWNKRKWEQAINAELDARVSRRAVNFQNEAVGATKSQSNRSVIDLCLNAYEKSMSTKRGKPVERIVNPEDLPTDLRQDMIQSVKSFFFAGHDTSSSVISWCFYLLHRYPEARGKVIAEMDRFFPPGESAEAKIRADPYIINKLEYTTAVIKETLRVFPPVSTIRALSKEHPVPRTSIIDRQTGQELPLEGAHIWCLPRVVHRNTRFFPKPTHFIPERFIPSQTPFPGAELFTPAGKAAMYAFNVGPRACIGQELAMLEMKIVLALTVREFDFVLEYPGEEADPQPPIPESLAAELDEKTEYGRGIRNGTIKHDRVEGHRVWSTVKGTAKPEGGCPGRVKLTRGYI